MSLTQRKPDTALSRKASGISHHPKRENHHKQTSLFEKRSADQRLRLYPSRLPMGHRRRFKRAATIRFLHQTFVLLCRHHHHGAHPTPREKTTTRDLAPTSASPSEGPWPRPAGLTGSTRAAECDAACGSIATAAASWSTTSLASACAASSNRRQRYGQT